jgi:carboxyl-terminal processing protease
VQAIDYGHRNPDGSFPRLPDSLRSAFKTKAGRLVYDGAGIDPDISTGKSEQSPFVKALVEQKMIFDYATSYFHKNPKPGEGFFLSDAEFKNFKSWLGKQDFAFETAEQIAIKQLQKEAEDPAKMKGALDQLMKVAAANAEQLLDKNAEEVRNLLELEILSRYHYQKAMKFVAFERDKDIQEALKVFSSPERYKSLLKK